MKFVKFELGNNSNHTTVSTSASQVMNSPPVIKTVGFSALAILAYNEWWMDLGIDKK